MSISDISGETGLAKTSIWKCLRLNKLELRRRDPIPFERWRQGTGKMRARPPFGFSYFRGEVIKDPEEYPTLQLIQNLKKQGMSISAIVRHLNAKRIKSRMKKPWTYNVIKTTVRRISENHKGDLK